MGEPLDLNTQMAVFQVQTALIVARAKVDAALAQSSEKKNNPVSTASSLSVDQYKKNPSTAGHANHQLSFFDTFCDVSQSEPGLDPNEMSVPAYEFCEAAPSTTAIPPQKKAPVPASTHTGKTRTPQQTVAYTQFKQEIKKVAELTTQVETEKKEVEKSQQELLGIQETLTTQKSQLEQDKKTQQQVSDFLSAPVKQHLNLTIRPEILAQAGLQVQENNGNTVYLLNNQPISAIDFCLHLKPFLENSISLLETALTATQNKQEQALTTVENKTQALQNTTQALQSSTEKAIEWYYQLSTEDQRECQAEFEQALARAAKVLTDVGEPSAAIAALLARLGRSNPKESAKKQSPQFTPLNTPTIQVAAHARATTEAIRQEEARHEKSEKQKQAFTAVIANHYQQKRHDAHKYQHEKDQLRQQEKTHFSEREALRELELQRNAQVLQT